MHGEVALHKEHVERREIKLDERRDSLNQSEIQLAQEVAVGEDALQQLMANVEKSEQDLHKREAHLRMREEELRRREAESFQELAANRDKLQQQVAELETLQQHITELEEREQQLFQSYADRSQKREVEEDRLRQRIAELDVREERLRLQEVERARDVTALEDQLRQRLAEIEARETDLSQHRAELEAQVAAAKHRLQRLGDELENREMQLRRNSVEAETVARSHQEELDMQEQRLRQCESDLHAKEERILQHGAVCFAASGRWHRESLEHPRSNRRDAERFTKGPADADDQAGLARRQRPHSTDNDFGRAPAPHGTNEALAQAISAGVAKGLSEHLVQQFVASSTPCTGKDVSGNSMVRPSPQQFTETPMSRKLEASPVTVAFHSETASPMLLRACQADAESRDIPASEKSLTDTDEAEEPLSRSTRSRSLVGEEPMQASAEPSKTEVAKPPVAWVVDVSDWPHWEELLQPDFRNGIDEAEERRRQAAARKYQARRYSKEGTCNSSQCFSTPSLSPVSPRTPRTSGSLPVRQERTPPTRSAATSARRESSSLQMPLRVASRTTPKNTPRSSSTPKSCAGTASASRPTSHQTGVGVNLRGKGGHMQDGDGPSGRQSRDEVPADVSPRLRAASALTEKTKKAVVQAADMDHVVERLSHSDESSPVAGPHIDAQEEPPLLPWRFEPPMLAQ